MSRPRPFFRSPTPREQGYLWPAEWAPHEATWLAWPHDEDTWPGCLGDAEAAFANLAEAIGRGETVHLLVKDARTELRARSALETAGAKQVRFHRIATADSWFRDYGPIVVARGRGKTRERLALDFVFNAWGEKYSALMRDTGIPSKLEKIHEIPPVRTRFVLEGGSIEGNGLGTLITTEQCLLGENRNPRFTREEIERHLRELLGVRHILWLGSGIEGDDTDGHIDDITRFVGPRTVMTVVPDDPKHPDAAALHDNHRRLLSMADQDGVPLEVVALPAPAPVKARAGHPLPASYANFYIANKTVAVPVFGDKQDKRALRLIGKAFPKREIVPIRCNDLIEGFGALHCVTQQLPR